MRLITYMQCTFKTATCKLLPSNKLPGEKYSQIRSMSAKQSLPQVQILLSQLERHLNVENIKMKQSNISFRTFANAFNLFPSCRNFQGRRAKSWKGNGFDKLCSVIRPYQERKNGTIGVEYFNNLHQLEFPTESKNRRQVKVGMTENKFWQC